MKVNLVAVQPKMELADYARFEAFHRKVVSLMERAMREVDSTFPTFIVFPEYFGMYLGFIPYHWEAIKDQTTMVAAVDIILAKNRARAERGTEERRAAVQRVLFIDHAAETECAYMRTFSELAREYRVYLVAGSLCVPPLDESPHRGGRFVRDDTRVLNQCYLFSPSGVCVGRVAKVNIPPGEDFFVDGGSWSNLVPMQTRMGRVGVLLCWDGYHHRTIEHYDSLAVDIVVQPAYFASPDIRFDGSGKLIPQPWDFVSLIQGRESIQYGIGAFMVGAVFEDRRAEGLSFIARNTGAPEIPWANAIVARTDHPYAEAIVTAAVDVERR